MILLEQLDPPGPSAGKPHPAGVYILSTGGRRIAKSVPCREAFVGSLTFTDAPLVCRIVEAAPGQELLLVPCTMKPGLEGRFRLSAAPLASHSRWDATIRCAGGDVPVFAPDVGDAIVTVVRRTPAGSRGSVGRGATKYSSEKGAFGLVSAPGGVAECRRGGRSATAAAQAPAASASAHRGGASGRGASRGDASSSANVASSGSVSALGGAFARAGAGSGMFQSAKDAVDGLAAQLALLGEEPGAVESQGGSSVSKRGKGGGPASRR